MRFQADLRHRFWPPPLNIKNLRVPVCQFVCLSLPTLSFRSPSVSMRGRLCVCVRVHVRAPAEICQAFAMKNPVPRIHQAACVT